MKDIPLLTMDTFDEKLSQFLACWKSLPHVAGTILPSRKSFSPAHFGPLFSNIARCERRSRKDFTFIFCGSEFETVSGIKATGRNYYDILAPSDHDATVQVHDTIFSYPCGTLFEHYLQSKAGNMYSVTTVVFPLHDETTDSARFAAAYAGGKKPLHDNSAYKDEHLQQSMVKTFQYIDMGAGAPQCGIENFQSVKNVKALISFD